MNDSKERNITCLLTKHKFKEGKARKEYRRKHGAFERKKVERKGSSVGGELPGPCDDC